MAPTVYDDDDMESYGYQRGNRVLRHRSVINYVGRQANKSDESMSNTAAENVSDSSERQNSIKRNRASVDACESIPNPMTFHNYAKRRKFHESEDDVENQISTSDDSADRSVSSTISGSDNADRKKLRLHSIKYLLPPNPLAPYSPVSSTTDAMSLYRCTSKASARTNLFYQQDLMEIAMKTIILLQKNRSLHARLNQLKLETRAFVNSVMSNPENAKLRQSNAKPIDYPTNKVLTVKNQ